MLIAPAVSDDPRGRFAVLSPQSLIDAANSSSRNRLLLGLILSLALVSLVAYFEGRSIVRTLTSNRRASQGALRGRGATARSSSTSAYSRSVRFTTHHETTRAPRLGWPHAHRGRS